MDPLVAVAQLAPARPRLPGAIRDPSLVDSFLGGQPKPRIEAAPKGRILVHQGDFTDESLLLLEGWLAFSKMLPEGETQIIDVLLPGDFALVGAVHAPVAACSVEALSDVRYITLRPAHANGPHPDMARLRELMAAEIVRTQSRTSELLLRMGRANAANRIAYALLEFHVRLEAVGLAEGGRFAFPMTQHKLGEFTGLSNVHVCRTMRRLERAGIIAHPAPGEIELRDMAALCDLSGIDLDAFRSEILARRRR
jgi:CRP-like cAMP-binding protein